MADNKKYTFGITRKGASHRSKVNGKWVTYSDDPSMGSTQIELTLEQARSPAYNNLGLQGPLVSGKQSDVLIDTVNPAVTKKTTSAARVGDGIQVDEDNQPLEEGKQVKAPEGGTAGTKVEGAEGTEEDEAAPVSKRKLNSLIKGLEESSGNAEFQEQRQKVLDAEIFEAETVPTRKAELIQALIDLRDGESEE